MALAYLAAFWSLGSQVTGLIGERGILPAGEYLAVVRAARPEGYLGVLPTLGWLGVSDAALLGFCVSGAILALAAGAGTLSAPALVLCYVLYLSLVHLGQVFLHFQWDILLTEAGFLAIFVAPWSPRPRWPREIAAPPRAMVWMLRLLLFKLMLSSGVTKLSWDDPTWWDLSALSYHYWSQPIPTWLAWYAHQLPIWVHRLSCGAMFFIEIVLPFGIFGPRVARITAFWGFVGLQLLIGLTGNYGFFNLLTLVLCLPLLEDADLPRPVRELLAGGTVASPEPPRWRRFVWAPVAAVLALLSVVPITEAFRSDYWSDRPDHPLLTLRAWSHPLLISGSYGLFRTMTTARPEIEIQGSLDGTNWRTYEFRYKPGPTGTPPPFLGPHMPRLDWQMWFAALSAERLAVHGDEGVRYWWTRQDPWVQRFAMRLLEGEPSVVGLLAEDPFSGERPRFLRLVLWRYSFTEWEGCAGGWWAREHVTTLLGPIQAPPGTTFIAGPA